MERAGERSLSVVAGKQTGKAEKALEGYWMQRHLLQLQKSLGNKWLEAEKMSACLPSSYSPPQTPSIGSVSNDIVI